MWLELEEIELEIPAGVMYFTPYEEGVEEIDKIYWALEKTSMPLSVDGTLNSPVLEGIPKLNNVQPSEDFVMVSFRPYTG